MKKIYNLFLLVFLFVNQQIKAQHPVYTHLTEKDGLPDIEFYSIVEDDKGFIWLGADKGLFRYDGKEFKNYTHPEKRGLSVFGLKLDNKGRVWCNNISGQVFYVDNEGLKLFKDFKKEVNGQLAAFSFFKNDLIISTYSGVYQVNKTNLKQKRISTNQVHFQPFYVKKDTVISVNDYKVKIKPNNTKQFEKYDLSTYKKYELNKWDIFSFRNKTFLYAHNTNDLEVKPKLFYEQKEGIKEIKLPKELEMNIVIQFYVENDVLWICTKKGVFVYDLVNNKLSLKETYFKGKEVSGILKDRNNNYWFTTLRSGVYIIPNLHIKKYKIEEEKINISAMSRTGDNSLIIGSTKGDLGFLNIKNNELKFTKNYNQKVYSICDSKDKTYISLNSESLIFDKKSNNFNDDRFCSNAKDLSFIDENNVLYASHGSATIININNKNVVLLKKIRAYTTYYSRDKKEIYVGYVDGVEMYDENLKPSELLFNNKPIFAIDIDETTDGTIWISTFKDGIIGVKNGVPIVNYTTKNGLLSNRTGKIKGDGTTLWLTTQKGLQSLNTKTGEFKNLTQKDGINSFNITEIVPYKKDLFFSSNKGLFKVNKEQVFKERNISNFYFTSIFINDKKVEEKNTYELTSDTKKIKFNFHTNGFLAENNVVYQYKLISNSETEYWNLIDKGVSQITFNNLAAGNYTLKIKATEINSKKETKERVIKLIIKLPFYKEWWFLLTSIFFSFLLTLFFFTKRIDRIEAKQKEAVEKERMQKQLISSKLESLQSQMNPHFTFNALNSIQNLILKDNKYEAYDYLNKFSLLIRENLNMNKKSFVLFDEELQMLTKYLELEKLRFRDSFDYEIIINEEIQNIKIPTMIIQPYIENAIKHGLLHKQGNDKKITLKFIQEETLKCVIIDNGVGIEASKRINNQNKNKHKSFSTKAIQERMVFLRDYYKTDIGVVYENIKVGTKVIIKIPYTF